MSGYFKVQRGIFDHDFFADEPFTEREAWLWLIENASHKEHKARVGKFRAELKRGQYAGSVRFLAEKWLWHRSKVERFLKRLKTETMIETQSETGVLVITICKYDKFQGEFKESETVDETPIETVPRQYRDKLQEGKEGKEITTPHSGREPKNDFQKVFEFATELVPGLKPKNPGIIHQWVDKYDVELDIKPTIKRLCESRDPDSIGGFGFFAGAIADAHRSRTKPLPEGKATSPTPQKAPDTISSAMYVTLKERSKRGEFLDGNERRAMEAYEKHQLAKVTGQTANPKPQPATERKVASIPKPPNPPPEQKPSDEERAKMAEQLAQLTAEFRAN